MKCEIAMKSVLVGALGLLAISSVTVLAQASADRVLLYQVRVGYYVADPIYVSGPAGSARYVFFPGDQIQLVLEFFNGSQRGASYPITGRRLGGLFATTVLSAPVRDLRPRLVVSQFASGPGRMVQPTTPPDSTLDIPPGNMVEIRATLEGAVAPGVYEIQIVPAVGQTLINSGVIRFEIRRPSDRAARAEMLYRRMVVAVESGDCDKALSESGRLLGLHPNSSAAHQIRGECAERAGRKIEAVAEFTRARDLLVLGLDDLFLAHADAQRVKAWIDDLSEAASAVGQPRTPAH
jgi:hypothetical protein